MTAETTSHAAMSSEPKARSIGCCLPHVARILFGLVFFVFGLNGFIQFIPQPKSAMSEEAMSFAGALMKTDYMHALIFGTQVTAGALLLLNRFVPLALALIAPVVVNIVAFHLFLAPSGIPMAAVVLALEAYLAWSYRESFRPMLAWRARPGALDSQSPNPAAQSKGD
jgi:uncharacterized membrane protein YphA (DoxX/SURF4 family)